MLFAINVRSQITPHTAAGTWGCLLKKDENTPMLAKKNVVTIKTKNVSANEKSSMQRRSPNMHMIHKAPDIPTTTRNLPATHLNSDLELTIITSIIGSERVCTHSQTNIAVKNGKITSNPSKGQLTKSPPIAQMMTKAIRTAVLIQVILAPHFLLSIIITDNISIPSNVSCRIKEAKEQVIPCQSEKASYRSST